MAEARLALVGCGRMARHHLLLMLAGSPETVYPVVSEPSAANYAAACELFRAAGREPPPNEPDLSRLLAANAGRLDAAFIITPHACHHDQALACLEAGLDVLLEKPM
ncbi:MAG: Gfo/Idh/MocA family oxidoreductase, partial [Candidatus Promineifilaceae bacterium]